MIGHEAKRTDLPAGLGTSLGQSFQKPRPVAVIAEDLLPAISPIYHTINRAGKLDSQFARHAPIPGRKGRGCQYYSLTPHHDATHPKKIPNCLFGPAECGIKATKKTIAGVLFSNFGYFFVSHPTRRSAVEA
jgi:hypothetical protein